MGILELGHTGKIRDQVNLLVGNRSSGVTLRVNDDC
jgi:hypothetical protein